MRTKDSSIKRAGLFLETEALKDNLVNFSWRHDYNYGKEMIEALSENGIGVMDRGFAGLNFLAESHQTNKYFCSQIYKLEYVVDSELIKVRAGNQFGEQISPAFTIPANKLENFTTRPEGWINW